MSEEQYLREQLAALQESYQKAAQPFIDKLVRIEAMRVPAYIVAQPVAVAQPQGDLPQDEESDMLTIAYLDGFHKGKAAALAGQQEGWISVDERLPDNGVEVIAVYHPYNQPANGYGACNASIIDGVWYDGCGDEMHPVHYWRPLVQLPAAPQQGTQGGGE